MRLVVATSAEDPFAVDFWEAYARAGGPPPAAVMVLERRQARPWWQSASEGVLLFGPRGASRAWARGRRVRALLLRDPQQVVGGAGAFHRVASLNRGDGYQTLQRSAPDLFVSAGSPEVFRPHVLRQATIGAVNVHNGRLPAFRGLFGTFWETLNDEEWGYASIHVMLPEVDAGPVLAQAPVRLAGRALWDILVDKKRLGGALLAWLVQFAERHGHLPPPCPYNDGLAPGYYSWPSLGQMARFHVRRWVRRFRNGPMSAKPVSAWPADFAAGNHHV